MYYALTKDGKKVSSLSADKNNKYFCPGCKSEVILKKGKINVEHFAHKILRIVIFFLQKCLSGIEIGKKNFH